MEIVGVHPVVCSEHVFSAFSYPLQFFYLSSDKAMWYSDKVMWCLVMVMLCWSVDGIININLVPRSTYLYGTSSKNAWNKSRTTCTSLPSSRRRWRLLVRILCVPDMFSLPFLILSNFVYVFEGDVISGYGYAVVLLIYSTELYIYISIGTSRR